MAHKRLKPWQVLLGILGITGLVAALLAMKKATPQSVITARLSKAGLPEQTVKYWVAVSAFETAGWTSQVFMDSKNLFNLIVPGKPALSYGEHQTIYSSLSDAADDVFNAVIKPFKYPYTYVNLQQLTDTMKSNGYYVSDANDYYAGTSDWYNKLFPS